MLRREITWIGLREVFCWFVFIALAAGVVGVDGPDRFRYAVGACIAALGAMGCRSLRKQRALPVEQRRARRSPKVTNAPKRRMAAIIVVMVVYDMIRVVVRPDLPVLLACSLVACGLIVVVLNVRKQHFARVVRGLSGRPGSSDTDAFGRSRRDR